MIEVQYNGIGDPIGIVANGSSYSLEALIAMAQRVEILEQELVRWREKAGRWERHAVNRTAQWQKAEGRAGRLRWALAQMCEERERAEAELAALQARLPVLEAAAGVEQP